MMRTRPDARFWRPKMDALAAHVIDATFLPAIYAELRDTD
jgi:hypothetical protein